MARPIVVCGLGRMGNRVLDYLRGAGMPVVVIDTLSSPGDPRLAGARLVVGDCRRREVLEEAGIAEAGGVLILVNDDLLNVSTALMVRRLNPDVRIVLRMFNQNLLGRLGKALRNVFALSTSLLTAPTLATAAVTGQGLGMFRLEGVTGRRQVAEVAVGPGSPLIGRTLGSLATEQQIVALAHTRPGAASRHLLAVDGDLRLEAGDSVVLCAEPRTLVPLLGAGRPGGAELRWASWLRRAALLAWRAVAEVDSAVKVCTAILLVVLFTSTLILHLGVERYRLPEAFLRTVSIMTTGSSLHEEDLRDSPRVMVFVSCLRIAGAALVAAFTAIVTQYLLRARLGGLLEMRRVPDAGHVIVCGLSTIGFRVVEELVGFGERVVVVELDPTNRFVTTARRLGVAVIAGDAGVTEVLRQAHAGTARAVIATTNNDMTNLEVALLVRDLNPAQRVVLLINDPQFAQMLREAADVRLALSVPALAAPAFVAGLFGDRVASVFFLGDRVYSVVDLVINAGDPFNGHVLRAVAIDYRLQPITLIRGGVAGATPAGARLQPGDRLVAVLALPDLERLFRRQPSSAAFAVEVQECPLPARAWLAGLVRATAGLPQEEASRLLESLPFCLADNLTRGQAEDLLAVLTRERVTARVRAAAGLEGPGGPAS